jgi:hypothetical protein
MRKFVFKLMGLSIIPIAFLISIESIIFFKRVDILSEEKMEKSYLTVGQSCQWINKIQSENKILLLGSSCVRYGLSCSKLNELSKDSLSFINLAMDARDPIETYFILKQIDLKNVKAAYMGLDSWIYAKSYYKYKNSYLYLDMDFITSVKYTIEHDRNLFLKRYKAFFTYLFPTNNIKREFVSSIPNDFGSVKLCSKPINFNEPIYKWFQIDKYGWSQLQFIYLNKIDSLCKVKNINFYVFITPKRSDYTATYKLKCDNIHSQFVANIVKEGLKAEVFGKLNQLNKVGDYDLFQEAYHLNSNGQIVYSSIFYEMILTKKEKFSQKYSWFTNN